MTCHNPTPMPTIKVRAIADKRMSLDDFTTATTLLNEFMALQGPMHTDEIQQVNYITADPE